MTEQQYCKKLIEVDFPIKRISEYARREKSIRQGHISSLHIWWARRPLAACRAVLCAALWPDPVDPLCSELFKKEAARLMQGFRDRRGGKAKNWDNSLELRIALLDFIAEFSNWENSTNVDFLRTSRTLTQFAYGNYDNNDHVKPVVVDPFAGGGAFPIEATRVGAKAFAGDLNSLAATLNKVILEYCPQLRGQLSVNLELWGEEYSKRISSRIEKFYPKDSNGKTVICYFWARTIKCEGPNCGVEVPIIRHFQFAKRSGNEASVEVFYSGDKLKTKIHLGNSAKKISGGTSRRSSVTCPKCGYTTPSTLS